jgi:hypothetical protein
MSIRKLIQDSDSNKNSSYNYQSKEDSQDLHNENIFYQSSDVYNNIIPDVNSS